MSDPLKDHRQPFALPSETQAHASETQGTGINDSITPPSKPIRLALACYQCRKRKVRCDAQLPKCRNCSVRGDVCETSDLRKPGGSHPAVRRRAACARSKRFRGKSDRGLSPAAAERHARQIVDSNSNPTNPNPGRGFVPVNSINSVLNHAAPVHVQEVMSGSGSAAVPEPVVFGAELGVSPSIISVDHHVSPSVEARSMKSAVNGSNGSTVSPANSSWRTTQSERLGEDHYSWQSRAYEETHGQDGADGARAGGEAQRPDSEEVQATEEVDHAEEVSRPRTKHLGASSVQCLFNFVDLHLTQLGFRHDPPIFKHGMLHTEEFPMPVFPKMPLLPDRRIFSTYLDVFFANIWPIHPIIDRAELEIDVNTIYHMQAPGHTWPEDISLSEIPTLVSILHGHLTATPYSSSVQALFLLALALRSVAKDGQAWHILGQAIRIAQSIGLHKSAKRHESGEDYILGPGAEGLRERLWWALFGLEKLMQLECGRPSIIDRSYDSLRVTFGDELESDLESESHLDSARSTRYFRAWIGLATLMGNISHRLYAHKFMGGSAEMLGAVAQLDLELSQWENSLPSDMRPQRALIDAVGSNHHILATFLSQQYYHAQLSILRVSVLFPQPSITREITTHIHTTPILSRLHTGATTCAHAARSIITQSLHLEDNNLDQNHSHSHNYRSTLLSVSPTYLAAVILALVVLRQPRSRLVRSDVELLASATEFVEGCVSVSASVSASLSGPAPAPNPSSNTLPRPSHPNPATRDNGHSQESVHGLHAQTAIANSTQATATATAFFSGFDFEELWNLTDLDFMVHGEENAVYMP
ncbi:Fungal Zn(2)-Cys(6) binuclear cluster domain-containing protein [Penicillium ucsense]|uniref:Fungal Zn(2)-Cys(6) binuclear cluster domain-containing protein n=1 Tax=Penicillium ucsense TaxID=2839758 RepID=A0A8J8W7H0_9EURO|nr:Fungal Zn(2)-Cys(6) binuclear cluster domain-containing protein [Penicillium ucsense]KAF7738132.1 Fungal Zn(2)-Cys(6) binuclear cluster domain-containing protein [Penicillium ucsense]